MTPKNVTRASLTGRLTEAQDEIRATADKWASQPYGTWLRAMAGHRRTVAAIYREASHLHTTDTIEWHALMDAALTLEMHATANVTAAEEHETAYPSEVDGAHA